MRRSQGTAPRKALGQHWLVDSRVLERIAAAADFTGEDTVVEVGAGTGLLTSLLASGASRLIAVEVDARLCSALRSKFAGRANVAVVEADVLAKTPEEILSEGGGRMPYVVVGNLPYFIGTAIVRRFLRAVARPRWLLVTLQAEVAESMAAEPGRMTYLSVETQIFAEPRVLFYIPAKAFRPRPKVRSAVLRLDVAEPSKVEVDDTDAFLGLVRAGFAAPRKQVRNSLAIGLRVSAAESATLLAAAGIDPAVRPSQLTLDDWRALYFAWRASKG